ncbi:MAG TPA: DoxX family protein [Planctomycetota bacterium]|nr:DoxX family protein [Planctomycetota bacterium]
MPSILSSENLATGRAVLVLRLLLAAFFAFLAVKNLAGDKGMAEDFRRWGYGDGFRITLAVAQLGGAVALFIPALSFAGALGLAVVLVGALATHLRHDPPLQAAPALVCLLLLLPVLWAARPPLLR